VDNECGSCLYSDREACVNPYFAYCSETQNSVHIEAVACGCYKPATNGIKMNKDTLFEVSGSSSAILSLRWNYKKCKGIESFKRLVERIEKSAKEEQITGEVMIKYWQPHRSKQEIVIIV